MYNVAGSRSGIPYKEKYVFYLRGQTSRDYRLENLHDGRAVSHTRVSSLFLANGYIFKYLGNGLAFWHIAFTRKWYKIDL